MLSKPESRLTLRQIARKTGRILFIAAYVVVAAEAFLRIFAPQALMPRYVCAGENGIRANEPNRRYWHSAPSFRVSMRINSHGVRADRDIPYEKSEGVKRIVFLGDSYGIGYGVNVEDTFAMVLERELNAAGVPCEVINLSVSGFGSAEELVMLTTEGFKYCPDLAIIQFNSSDPRETLSSGLFALENGRLVRANATYLPAVQIQKKLSSFALYRFIAERSELYAFVRERSAEFVKRRVMPAVRALGARPSQANVATTPETASGGDAASYDYRLTLAVLEAAEDACRGASVGFMALDIPADRGRDNYAPNDFWTWLPARESGLLVCEPADDFQARKGQELYDPWSNSHLTPLGNRIVGEKLARFILEHKLLKGEAARRNGKQ